MIFDKRKTLCNLTQPVIVSSENERKHVAHNVDESRVFHYRIDGDIITDCTVRKCDFLIENETKKDVYFIELKGSNLRHAICQIESSVNMLRDKIRNYNIKVRIVCHSRSHQIDSNEVRKFKEKYRERCIIRNGSIVEDI